MKNVKTIITLIIGATIGFSFCQLFHRKCDTDLVSVPVVEANVSFAKKQLQETENKYQQKEDSLNLHNSQLTEQLRQTSTALTKAKKKNNQLQQQVYTLIDRQGIYKEIKDTAAYYSNCDSLANLASQLIVVAGEQDSVSQISIQTLGQQVQNRDSAIVLRMQQYQNMKSTLNESLFKQELLSKEVKQYRKKFKRQRLWGKVKTAGLLILSGLAAKQILQ